MTDITRALRAAINEASRKIERLIDADVRIRILREDMQNNADYRMVTSSGFSEPLSPKVGREIVKGMLVREVAAQEEILRDLRDGLRSAVELIK